MFRANPAIQRIPLGQSVVCVIDDALEQPQRWVEEAAARIGEFAEAPYNAYPGMELRLPAALAAAFADYFDRHLRREFGVRRTLEQHAKLALVTRREDELQPQQTIPHMDPLRMAPGQCALASVLYLFQDESLGGTSFFRPRVDPQRLHALFDDAARLDAEAFSARHGIPRAYFAASDPWFERVLTVPPRWNRLIVYSGTIFHSGDIPHPDRLSADPRRGRLTLNGFLTCRRQLAASTEDIA